MKKLKGDAFSDEDSILSAKICDLISLSEKRCCPCFSDFLNLHEIHVAVKTADSNAFSRFVLFGGYEHAERKIFAALPDYIELSDCTDDFPIVPLTFEYKKEFALSHRDFLGALMAQGIKRNCIGDIVVTEGRAVVFVKEDMADYISLNIDKVGRVGVKISKIIPPVISEGNKFIDISTTVSSMRLDCIVSALTGLSRDKSSSLIFSKNVFINSSEVSKQDVLVKCGDTITVRKKGKFIIDSVNGNTKKGRIKISVKKYS